jgi:hypothetical protein
MRSRRDARRRGPLGCVLIWPSRSLSARRPGSAASELVMVVLLATGSPGLFALGRELGRGGPQPLGVGGIDGVAGEAAGEVRRPLGDERCPWP